MLLLGSDPVFAEHVTGPGHPESPERLEAVAAGIARADLGSDLVELGHRDATERELERVHPRDHLAALRARCESGDHLDADTPTSRRSWAAAVAAAGAGLAAVDALEARDASAAFVAVRPPGHHARPRQAMGFCLINNVAVVASELRARGERVAIVDIDAHHGNGTQEVFASSPDVFYVSFHEWPLYPGTGRHDEIGSGPGAGTTCNLPLPAGATGDVYFRALDDVVEPLLASFGPTWLLISAGFDAHRDDPLTGLALSAGDYAGLVRRLMTTVPTGRTVAFLEGGYSLSGLADSVAATIPVLAGAAPERLASGEAPTAGGPGHTVVDAVARMWREYLGECADRGK